LDDRKIGKDDWRRNLIGQVIFLRIVSTKGLLIQNHIFLRIFKTKLWGSKSKMKGSFSEESLWTKIHFDVQNKGKVEIRERQKDRTKEKRLKPENRIL